MKHKAFPPKKIKLLLLSAAIILGTGGAFASRYLSSDCTSLTQYYLDPVTGQYLHAGEFGVDFICGGGPGTCTYVLIGSSFVPCRTGEHITPALKTAHKK